MKIVHLIGYFQPEFGYEEYYLARKQAQLGHAVYVVTSDRFVNVKNIENLLNGANAVISRKRKVGLSIVDGFKVYRLPCLFEFSNFILVKGVKRILSNIKPDVVHAHEPIQGTPAVAALYKEKLGYKLIVDQHKFGFFSPLSKLEYMLFRKHICNFAYAKADKIIATTKEARKFLMNIHKIEDDRIVESPLGADTETFRFDECARKDTRHSLGIGLKDVVLIFAGKIERYKRLELLIESFSYLSKDYRNVYLLLVGGGDNEYLNDLKLLVNQLGVLEKVKFINFVSKDVLYKYYSTADIGIWPEQPSITIIESMACKLALVLPDMDTTNHLIAFDNGLTFPLGDAETLRNCLKKLVLDKELREVMRENSYNAAKQNFSYDVIAKKVLRIYEGGYS